MKVDVFPVDKAFRLDVVEEEEIELSDDSRKYVDRLWDALVAQDKGGQFNGYLFSGEKFDPIDASLKGRYRQYKEYYAKRQDPSLARELKVAPVGVTGVSFFERESGELVYLLGRRGANVNDAGKFEFAPAGGIDKTHFTVNGLDFRKQLLTEFEEETTLSQKYVSKMTPRFLANVPDLGFWEILVDLHLDPLIEKKLPAYTEEYSAFKWVNQETLFRLVADHEEAFIPFFREMMEGYFGVHRCMEGKQ